MKKTKAEIMKDIIVYAQGKEITPSLIRKYLMEELHLSRGSAYRFLNKADGEYIFLEERKYERRDYIDYSSDEYEKIIRTAFALLHRMGKNSLHTIDIQEIQKIAQESGTTPRFLSCNILGLDTNDYDKLIKGQIRETKLSLGLGFSDPILSEKVKDTKHQLIQSSLRKKYTLEEIRKLAEEREIPLQIMLEKVFCLTRKQILNLNRGKSITFLNSREFIDYDYNEPASYEDIKRNSEFDKVDNDEFIIFTEEDRDDSMYEDETFYIITAETQEDFIEQLNAKKEQLKLKKEYLIEKYDEMYLELLNSYKELNITNSKSLRHTPITNKKIEACIQQIKEIISRNPKYYKYYPPKLSFKDLEKIADDFNIDASFLAYKMFGESHYNARKENKENPYFEIADKKIPEASQFYLLFQNEIDSGIKRIVGKTISSNTMVSGSIAEDLIQILRINVITRGNMILFYGRDCQDKDEYLSGIFAYLKAVCDSQCKKLRITTKSLNDKVKDDSDAEFGDFIASEEILSETEDVEESVENILNSVTDSSSQQIMEDMIRCLQETGNREDALKMLAREMKISTKMLQDKLDAIYEDFN